MNKRKTGEEWEKAAADFLEGQGMKVVERNFRSRQGEIDIIGYHRGYLVFVEVKYRGTDGKGHAADAVTYGKQRRICIVADYYRYTHRLGDNVAVRYDVVAVQGGELEWIQNAFPHIYTRCR